MGVKAGTNCLCETISRLTCGDRACAAVAIDMAPITAATAKEAGLLQIISVFLPCAFRIGWSAAAELLTRRIGSAIKKAISVGGLVLLVMR
jgi:hypothetical protein